MLYYAKACNEFLGPISTLLRPGKTALFEEILQRKRAVDKTVSNLTGQDLNLTPPAPAKNMSPVKQLAGIFVSVCIIYIFSLRF